MNKFVPEVGVVGHLVTVIKCNYLDWGYAASAPLDKVKKKKMDNNQSPYKEKKTSCGLEWGRHRPVHAHYKTCRL